MQKLKRYTIAFMLRLAANLKGYRLPLWKGYEYDYWYGGK
jgi:hypothetical protein